VIYLTLERLRARLAGEPATQIQPAE
jgi:hypothetical protein